jgi:hypothetical protein
MSRRVRLKLIGDGWHAYGGTIPEDRIIEISESEAAKFLHRRGSHRDVEILGWVDDDGESRDSDEIPD